MRSALALLVVFASLLSGPSASAQDDAAEARRHFDAGVQLFQAGEHARALDAFRDAYRVRPHPSVLVNMANCYLGMGRPLEASQHFERYLREADEIDPERRAEVERALAQARLAIATVEVHGPPGSTVFVDGEAVGRTPLVRPAEVNPGPHVIELRQPDGTVRQERVEVEPGGRAVIGGSPAPEAATTGLDAPRRTAVAPAASSAPEAPSSAALPSSEPPPADTQSGLDVPVATWIAGGVAVAALAGGIAFGATAMSQSDEFDAIVADIESLPPRHPDRERLQNDGEAVADAQATNALVADLLFVTAAAAAGLGLYFLLTQDDEVPETTVTAAAAPTGGALLVRHAF